MDLDLEAKKIESATIWARTDCFETGDGLRKRKMHQFMDVRKNPCTRFEVETCNHFEQLDDNTYGLTVVGTLDFMGMVQRLPLDVAIIKRGPALVAGLVFKWSFRRHGVKPPQLFFLKLKDLVEIRAHFEFMPKRIV